MAKEPEKKAVEMCDGGLYEVIDTPFYDGVVLHEIGARIPWAGPPSKALIKVGDDMRKSVTKAPVFADPLSGRGDGAKVGKGKALEPVNFVQ